MTGPITLMIKDTYTNMFFFFVHGMWFCKTKPNIPSSLILLFNIRNFIIDLVGCKGPFLWFASIITNIIKVDFPFLSIHVLQCLLQSYGLLHLLLLQGLQPRLEMMRTCKTFTEGRSLKTSTEGRSLKTFTEGRSLTFSLATAFWAAARSFFLFLM